MRELAWIGVPDSGSSFRRLSRATVILVAGALITAGCGSNSGGSSAKTADGARATIRAFAGDILNSRFGAACDLMTQQAQTQLGAGEASKCAGRLAFARVLIAGKAMDAVRAAASASYSPVVTITGDRATVPNVTGSGTAALIYTSGRWLIGPAGSSGSGASSTATNATPSAATVMQWPAKWCQAQPGMTRAQLYAIMGPPTEQFLTGTNPSASWTAYEYQFNAFFGVAGTVRQLDINDINLTASEKAALACATTRVAH